MNRTSVTLCSLAVSLGLAGFFAWLISAHFAPRPFASVFWPCLLVTLPASFFFAMFNVGEGVVIFVVCLLLALVSIPFALRIGAPALPYIAASAFIAGFASSRILRIKFFT